MKRQAIARLKGEHSVRACCGALGISRSSYYESAERLAERKEAERPIVEAIKQVHRHRFKRYYGSPRMTDELRGRGHNISRHRTARLMRKHGLRAAMRHRFVRTTDSTHKQPVAQNVLDRDFAVGAGSRAWCADITYLGTPHGWLYLAVVLDLRTRKWVGYAVAKHMESKLVTAALTMALYQEHDTPKLMHSDRGSQYASAEHRALLRQQGIALSMSRKGNCWDNAVTESFFGTLKTEAGDTFLDEDDARAVLFDYQSFYNRERKHSALQNSSPRQFEISLIKQAA